MKTIKHKVQLPITNMYQRCWEKRSCFAKHGDLFPTTLRTLICGPSNCCKSNVMLSLLLDINRLRFENVYIYSRSLYQPKYQFLEKIFKNIVIYFPNKDNEEIQNPEDARENSIFFSIMLLTAIKTKFENIPKQLIRNNVNFIILLKQDDLNLKHVYHDHVGSDMSFGCFKEMCGKCWINKYSFICIDKDKNFDEIIQLNKYLTIWILNNLIVKSMQKKN